MNAITPITQDNSELFFPVHTDEILHPQTHEPIKGYQGVFNSSTDELMVIHQDSYKLVPNQQLYETFEDALSRAGLMTSTAVVKDELSHGGCRAFRTIQFPDHQIDPGDGKSIAMQLIIKNSYDGSMSFQAMLGAYRFVCSNGMVLGKTFFEIKSKHTKNFEIDFEGDIEKLAEAADRFKDWEPRLKRWRSIGMNSDRIIDSLKKQAWISQRLEDHLVRKVLDDYGTLNVSLWDFYNSLTNWATHGEVRGRNLPATRDTRNTNIAKMIDGGAWKQLEAA